jgi:hypothetical protein
MDMDGKWAPAISRPFPLFFLKGTDGMGTDEIKG